MKFRRFARPFLMAGWMVAVMVAAWGGVWAETGESHPDAGEDGYVEMPNISVLEEMVDMMSATRSYHANVTTIKMAKRMALKALEIGR